MSSPPVVLPSVPWPIRLTVAGTRLLGPVLPSVAYRLAFFVRPAWESALIDSADDHVLLPWRGGHLVARASDSTRGRFTRSSATP